MKTVAIVQARMSSARLPGKVLLNLENKTVLWHVINRLKYSKMLDDIVIATSKDNSDNIIENWCKSNEVNCYRGSLNDVLNRYYGAAQMYKADTIVRITADCPLVDPEIVDEVIEGFLVGNFDLYGLSGSFPDGLDCSVFTLKALKIANKNAKLNSEREHVCPYIENNLYLFKVGGLKKFKNLGHHRWTLDEQEDYELLSKIFSKLFSKNKIFYTHEVLEFLKLNPELTKINRKIVRNEGYLKSLVLDN
jgi:spore coat polysaccharide biosynthesis protein SpsF